MKIAVIFPGIGYHCDKPLLYYSKKLSLEAGYEIKEVPYGGFESGIKGSPEKMNKAFKSALSQAEDILKDVSFDTYDDILFISKSVGTAVAAAYALEKGISARNVFYTPVEGSFEYIRGNGIIFTGSSDPWVKEGAIPKLCKEKGYKYFVIENGNHSLETGNAIQDINNLNRIMDITQNYINEQ